MNNKYFQITYDFDKLSDDEKKSILAIAQQNWKNGKAVSAGWESVAKVENDGWISVDDGLPKEFETVLLSGKKYTGEPLVTNGHLIQSVADEFGIQDGFSVKMFVTHWQPLPQPPKE